MQTRHRYTKEEIDFLRENVQGISLKELTKRFNEKFKLNSSKDVISHIKMKNGIKGGINPGLKQSEPVGTERIKNGFIQIKISQPSDWIHKHRYLYQNFYNVKLKKDEKICFLDGNKRNFDIENLILINKKHPVGTERITIYGYTEIKIGQPDKWTSKQRVVYEKYHKVKLNKEDNIIFLDGNKQNFEKENLVRIKRSDQMYLSASKRIPVSAETIDAEITLAKINAKIKKIKKKRNK